MEVAKADIYRYSKGIMNPEVFILVDGLTNTKLESENRAIDRAVSVEIMLMGRKIIPYLLDKLE